MTPSESVRGAHTEHRLRALHAALLDIALLMNGPQRCEWLICEAGVPLDRALFSLFVGVERFGPVGVVEMADRLGRDHTTVNRQVAKLESLGFAERRSSADRRVRGAVITRKGEAIAKQLDETREKIGRAIFETWDPREVDESVRLMRKFADTINELPSRGL
ncbi:MarR family winged helix-turn-helix transcriptional regulator [Consotaella aegiceratis]|uniref:MarR family winged helix-turn-helix transcriptional regulator n=1 Tax=Consotaella aegiceratis TaxID=3097961 RepID=UPI002F41F489